MTRIRRGELASVKEIMLVATLPRQTVNRWLREEHVDLAGMRVRHLAKLHQAEEEYLASRSGERKPSRQQRWRDTKRAVRRFNEANATESGSARAAGGAVPEVE